MYSLLAVFLGFLLIIVIGLILYKNIYKIKTLIGWCKLLLYLCSFSSLSIMIYYVNFYLGENNLLQKVYVLLFYLSIFLLLLIIFLKITIRSYKN